MKNYKDEKPTYHKYYKYYNYKMSYMNPVELKIDGKVVERNGALMGEIMTLGDIITKEEYDAD